MPLPAIKIWIGGLRHAALLTNQIQGLFQYRSGGACRLSQPNQENGPNSPDPFSLTEGGVWGRDYTVVNVESDAQ